MLTRVWFPTRSQQIFHTAWLDANEWLVVLWFSMPVVILDELLKWYGRIQTAAELAARTGAR